jgi:hypothetical protein
MRTSPLPRRTGLDPVGRLRRPRPGTVLRAALAALLLTAAVLTWHSGGGAGPPAPAGPALPSPASDGSATAAPPGPAGSPAGPPEGPPAGSPAAAHRSRLPIPDGMVGVPVPLGTPAATAMVLPGDRVDLLAVPTGGQPVTVAEAVTVLGVDRPDATVLLALSPAQAHQVVAASTGRFALVVRS